jgi:hypothetical protein
MQERRAIVFDNKIPLTWLLTSAGTSFVLLLSVLWNVAGQSNKLDQLVAQAEKIERHSAERDQKLEALIRENFVLSVRIDALEKKTK